MTWRLCWRILTTLVVIGITFGCGELRMPKRESIQVRGGGSSVEAVLASSTNCVDVGETVTITLTLTNISTTPFTFRGDPPINLAIDRNDRNKPSLIDAWSADSTYPKSFNPIMEPGEVRTYEWQWVARADFAQQAGPESGATIRYLTEGFSPDAAHLYLGVGWYTDGGYVVKCDQMR